MDAFLSFIEEDSLHHYDALRILEDNHFEKEDCYEIALMKCNKKAISDDLKLRLLFLMESYIKLNDLDIHIALIEAVISSERIYFPVFKIIPQV